eukprot:scaffold77013_cov39-Tisochrysis_lutea.AAC.1
MMPRRAFFDSSHTASLQSSDGAARQSALRASCPCVMRTSWAHDFRLARHLVLDAHCNESNQHRDRSADDLRLRWQGVACGKHPSLIRCNLVRGELYLERQDKSHLVHRELHHGK